jgi:hypothetical protein
METSVPAVAPAEPGLWSRVWGTLVAPRRVFESLRGRPRILGALLILVVLNAAAAVLMTDLIIEAQQQAMVERGQEIPPEAAGRMAQTMKVTVPLFGALSQVLIVFVLGGVLLFLTNILLGGSATYKGMVSAVAHIGFVTIPAVIVKMPLMMAKGRADAAQTSLAALLPAGSEKGVLHAVLSRFDLFELWMWGLTILAVAILGGVPTRKAAGGVILTWAVLSAVFVLLSRLIPGLQT